MRLSGACCARLRALYQLNDIRPEAAAVRGPGPDRPRPMLAAHLRGRGPDPAGRRSPASLWTDPAARPRAPGPDPAG
eukprot:7592587-Alexandrium_andersonii.AAC.1